MKIRYSSDKFSWLCFRHATQLAVQNNVAINVDIDDYDSEYYGGSTVCKLCSDEIDSMYEKLEKLRKKLE